NLQATLRALLEVEERLSALVLRTSRLLYATTPASKYATAFFLLLDPATGCCRYVNAGHNAGLVLRANGTVQELPATGFPVGLMGIGDYREEELSLAPGDAIALYSDGVNEANDRDGAEFGMERLEASLLSLKDRSAEDMVDGVFNAVDAFATGAPQYDDITMLVAKRRRG
ncbi:MAG: serine/threonine-protein phosphatase, partial [Acidobacteria bacterium]|nr:serine/threonine-protein phosphatase [Acidobacteriota bacterium]